MFNRIAIVILMSVLGVALVTGCGPKAPKSEEPTNAQHQAPAALNVQKVKLDVQGMTCSGCALGVEMALKKVPGVKKAEVDFDRNAAEVEIDPSVASVDELVKAVEKSGFSAAVARTN